VGEPALITAWTLLAFTYPAITDADSSGAAAKGLAFLKASPPESDVQLDALRLLLLRRTGGKRDEMKPVVKSLLEQQNVDGGWSQTKELASDAYMTGQALFALSEAGGAPKEAIRRAQSFLLSSQLPDGSWPMVSRSVAGAPPSKDASPIAFAGSGWATLGLVRSAPVKETRR
jgi:hypothetical protein